MPSLLDDFLSQDPGRILQATWETIGSRDSAVLDPLVAALPRIRYAADHVELGGVVRSNHSNFAHAVAKLENYRARTCWCANYPGLLAYNPEKQAGAGHITILSTSEPGWSMTYVCQCTVCGQVFDVEQGDHHFLWWEWVPRE